MADKDIILHIVDTAHWNELITNLSSGDDVIYNVIVAGNDGKPRLPNKTIRERLYPDGKYHFELDTEFIALLTPNCYIHIDPSRYIRLRVGTGERILFDSADGDYGIKNLVLAPSNSDTLYVDTNDNDRIKKRSPEPAIPNYIYDNWRQFSQQAIDPCAREALQGLIAEFNNLLDALRAHAVISP